MTLDAKQRRAILKEWSEAIEDGKWEVALKLERANPDLFPFGDEYGRPEDQSPARVDR